MTILWRDIPGYEGHYRVSTRGDVWSLKTAKQLRQATATHGRLTVCLSIEGARKTWLVYHLVMLAFVGPRANGICVRHLNGDKLDNRLENLCYGTKSENQRDDVYHGKRRLSVDDVREIRRRAATGETHRSISEDYPSSRRTICHVVNRAPDHYGHVS